MIGGGRTRWPNVRKHMSAPMSSPIAISAMPSTAMPVEHTPMTLVLFRWSIIVYHRLVSTNDQALDYDFELSRLLIRFFIFIFIFSSTENRMFRIENVITYHWQ